MRYIAQCIKIAGQEVCGPANFMGGRSDVKLADIINLLIAFIYPLSGVILFFILVWGGYQYLTSAGNAEKVKAAQGKISSGLIGFVLLMVSYLIVRVIIRIFGLGEGII